MRSNLERQPRRHDPRREAGGGAISVEEVPRVGHAVLGPMSAPTPPRRWLVIAAAVGLLVGAAIAGALTELDPANGPSDEPSSLAQWPVPSSIEGTGRVLGWSSVGAPGADPELWASDGDQLFVLDGRSLWIEQLDGGWVERPLEGRFGCAADCLSPTLMNAHDGLVLLTADNGEAAMFRVDQSADPITVSGRSPAGPEIDGLEIAGQAIGPAGAIVQYTSRLDLEGLLSTVLDRRDEEFTYTVARGVITVEVAGERTQTYGPADLGVTEAEIAGPTTQLWWTGAGGVWELATTFDGDDVRVVPADSGFYAISADRAFFSPDGRNWDMECCPRGSADRVVPWREGVLIEDDRGLRYLTAHRDEPVRFDDFAVDAMMPHDWFEVDAGSQGILVLSSDGREVAYSPNGNEWALSSLGPELALDADTLWWVGPNLVLADARSFVMWRSGDDGSIEFWRSEVGNRP